jgi:hypothetical protein
MCSPAKVKIENYDKAQEVHILFAATKRVESWLNETAGSLNNNGQHHQTHGDEAEDDDDDDDDDIMMNDDDDDSLSDFDSSSSSFDDDDDEQENDDETSGSDDDHEMNGHHHPAQPQDANPPTNTLKAYWMRERIRKTQHGHVYTYVYRATVLYKSDLYWVETNQQVAIKRMAWECIQASRNERISEDFVKEIAALQYLSNFLNEENNHDDNGDELSQRSHVMTANTIMANSSHVFIVMPYCAGGDIVERVAKSTNDRFTEATAKYWFRQMLTGLRTLQRAHLCHRDLSPENFIILDDKTLVIDFGMCLRIPYSEDGSRRHLISRQRPCGKLPHMPPEIFRPRPFDGHAVDIWSTGTVLLFMLTGRRLKVPPLQDGVFDNVAPSELELSDEAMDLLRRIFRLRPEDRLTLDEILAHQFLQSL